MWFDGTSSKANRKRRSSLSSVEPRSSDKRRMQVSRVRAIALAGVAVVVGGLAAWYALSQLEELLFSGNERYAITTIDIRSDGQVVTPEKVREWTGIREGQNLFAVSTQRVRDYLLKRVPIVKAVEVRRIMPGTLEIRIAERMPVARLGLSSYLGVDRAGYVFGITPTARSLPYIAGYREHLQAGMRAGGAIMNAIEVVDVCSRTRLGEAVKVTYIDVEEKGTLGLHLADGEFVRLAWRNMEQYSPDSRLNLEEKLRHLVRALQSASDRGKRISWIDLTFNEDYIPVEEN